MVTSSFTPNLSIILRVFFFFCFVLPFLPGFTQVITVEDDFEGSGTIESWHGDNCGMDNAFSNPFQSGINNSATVLRYDDTGAQYANVRFDVIANFDLASKHTFTLKVYVPSSGISGTSPNQLSLKLQDGTMTDPWMTQTEIIKPIALDQWQVLTFDFANDPYQNLDPNSPAPVFRKDLNRVLLQVNGENNNDIVLAYFDDFVYDGTIGSPPATSIYTQLVWSDECNGTGAIDPTKWFHQTKLPNGNSWFNGELQHYTNRTVNSFLENGSLHIVAKKETFTDQGRTKQYTSARLNSKFAFTYGRVEARAKLPKGLGTWPAIWMLGKNIIENGGYWTANYGTTGWPACGEIDIMEHWGNNQNYVQSALHTPSSFGATVNHGGLLAPNVSGLFHVYAMEWFPEEIQFSIDGYVYYTYHPSPKDNDNWPYVADQYLLLNIAITDPVDPSFTESPMVIDYIRVYQENTTSLSDLQGFQGIELFPNPIEDKLNIELPTHLLGASITVSSALGQELHSFIQTQSLQEIDWSSYPAGVYFVNVKTEKGQGTQKVVKR